MSFFSQFLQSTHFRYGTTWRASSSHTFQQICHHRVCYGIFSYASSIRLRKILSKDESFMKSCSHLGNDMFASIKVVTSRNLLSSLKECFAMLYLKVYRQKQLSKYLFSQLLQFFHVSISCASSSCTFQHICHHRYQKLFAMVSSLMLPQVA